MAAAGNLIQRTNTPDFGRTVEDYVRHRPDYPPELYERLARAFGVGTPAQRVLDLGTGTGIVARALAQRGCDVTALDPSPELLDAAGRLARAAQLDIRLVRGTAEATGLPDHSFDVVTAAVCWHWFDAPRAAAEIRRVLVPGGRLVIIHFGWLAQGADVVDETEELLRQHRPGLPGLWFVENLARRLTARLQLTFMQHVGSGFHPDRLATLRHAGYTDVESFSFDADMPYTHEAWRGRIRSHAWAGASGGDENVARLDGAVASMLRHRFPKEPLQVPHRIFVVTGRSP